MSDTQQVKMMVYAALMAALTAAGAYIAVPIGPVPIVLQNMFVLLTGLLLGSRWGLAGVGVYLLAGAFGLPVFAGGTGGIGRFFGPTGGYLLGYLPAVYMVGIVSEKTNRNAFFEVSAMIGATLLVYLIGVPWLKIAANLSWAKAMGLGMYPFLLGDAIKIAAAFAIIKAVRPVLGGLNS
ncbi:MAG: biotin transporter BioY [Desulfobacteraceae bacterium]|nr:biotin transporter BioY [Desulfobacteraceae bacterium]